MFQTNYSEQITVYIFSRHYHVISCFFTFYTICESFSLIHWFLRKYWSKQWRKSHQSTVIHSPYLNIINDNNSLWCKLLHKTLRLCLWRFTSVLTDAAGCVLPSNNKQTIPSVCSCFLNIALFISDGHTGPGPQSVLNALPYSYET